MSPLGQILLLATGTYLLRISFIALAGRFDKIPERVNTMLSMIPPSVLAAIAFESLLFDGDSLRGIDEWHIAIVIAGAVAYRTKNLALCIAVGMPTVWILAALG